MAIKISRLWRDADFHSLDILSKLLYIYLCTGPINSIGLLHISLDVAKMELGLDEVKFRLACSELIKEKYIYIYNYKGTLWFLVKGHFKSLPRSIAVSKKAQKEIKAVPEYVLDKMIVDGVYPDIEQHSEFKPPTPIEVTEYAMSKGYIIDGVYFCNFYQDNSDRLGKKSGWYDGRGKEVRDWKGKLRAVWFKRAEKMKHQVNAPDGFEFFCVKDGDKVLFPKDWRDGKPYGESISEDKILMKAFNELQKNS